MIERKCGNCTRYETECKQYVDENETFPETDGCDAFRATKPTNLEAIREMTAEQLAGFIMGAKFEHGYCKDCKTTAGDCKTCFVRWLNEEVKDE